MPTGIDNLAPLVQQWQEAKEALAAWQRRERDLRAEIIGATTDGTVDSGVENVPFGPNHRIAITHRLIYKLDDGPALDAALEDVSRSMGDTIAERLVKFKPELSVSEYKKLDPDVQKRFNRVITTKPGSPSLEIKEQK